MTSLKACDWSGYIFGASASPESFTKNCLCHPLPLSVHGGQHDAKYVTFELLLRTAFVADKNWGFVLEPARIWSGTVLELRTSLCDDVELVFEL